MFGKYWGKLGISRSCFCPLVCNPVVNWRECVTSASDAFTTGGSLLKDNG